MTYTEKLIYLIKLEKMSKNLSTKDLANSLSISSDKLGKILRGVQKIDSEIAFQLMEYFCISFDYDAFCMDFILDFCNKSKRV